MAEVSKLLWFVSHRYARAYNQRHGRINHLIGRRFHASEVPDRTPPAPSSVYIAMNPVRAGLCSAPARLGVRLVPGPRRRRPPAAAPLERLHTRPLRGRATTFEAAIGCGRRASSAVAGRRWRRSCRRANGLTPEHVRHAREIYGYTVHEIAAHYGRTAQTMKRWLSDAYEPPRLKRLSTSQ